MRILVRVGTLRHRTVSRCKDNKEAPLCLRRMPRVSDPLGSNKRCPVNLPGPVTLFSTYGGEERGRQNLKMTLANEVRGQDCSYQVGLHIDLQGHEGTF